MSATGPRCSPAGGQLNTGENLACGEDLARELGCDKRLDGLDCRGWRVIRAMRSVCELLSRRPSMCAVCHPVGGHRNRSMLCLATAPWPRLLPAHPMGKEPGSQVCVM